MIDEKHFENVKREGKTFRLPRRKWRELLFVGALAPYGKYYVRDPSRPMTPFRDPDLFPEGVRFLVHDDGDFVLIKEMD